MESSLHHVHTLIQQCKSPHPLETRERAYETLIDLASSPKSSVQVKMTVGENIPKGFLDFPHLQERAVDAVYDICEDANADVRMTGYRTFEQISRVAPSWVKRNTDVLIQLLQIDSPVEIALIRELLVRHISIAPLATLEVITDVLQDTNVADQHKAILLDTLLVEGESWRVGVSEDDDRAVLAQSDGREKEEVGVLRSALIAILSASSCPPTLRLPILSLLVGLPLPLSSSSTSTTSLAERRVHLTQLLLLLPPTSASLTLVSHHASEADPRALVRFWFESASRGEGTSQIWKGKSGEERVVLGWVERWLKVEKQKLGVHGGKETAGELYDDEEGKRRWTEVERGIVERVGRRCVRSMQVIRQMSQPTPRSNPLDSADLTAEFDRLEPWWWTLLALVQIPSVDRKFLFPGSLFQEQAVREGFGSMLVSDEIVAQHWVVSQLIEYFSDTRNLTQRPVRLPSRSFPPSWIHPSHPNPAQAQRPLISRLSSTLAAQKPALIDRGLPPHLQPSPTGTPPISTALRQDSLPSRVSTPRDRLPPGSSSVPPPSSSTASSHASLPPPPSSRPLPARRPIISTPDEVMLARKRKFGDPSSQSSHQRPSSSSSNSDSGLHTKPSSYAAAVSSAASPNRSSSDVGPAPKRTASSRYEPVGSSSLASASFPALPSSLSRVPAAVPFPSNSIIASSSSTLSTSNSLLARMNPPLPSSKEIPMLPTALSSSAAAAELSQASTSIPSLAHRIRDPSHSPSTTSIVNPPLPPLSSSSSSSTSKTSAPLVPRVPTPSSNNLSNSNPVKPSAWKPLVPNPSFSILTPTATTTTTASPSKTTPIVPPILSTSSTPTTTTTNNITTTSFASTFAPASTRSLAPAADGKKSAARSASRVPRNLFKMALTQTVALGGGDATGSSKRILPPGGVGVGVGVGSDSAPPLPMMMTTTTTTLGGGEPRESQMSEDEGSLVVPLLNGTTTSGGRTTGGGGGGGSGGSVIRGTSRREGLMPYARPPPPGTSRQQQQHHQQQQYQDRDRQRVRENRGVGQHQHQHQQQGASTSLAQRIRKG